MNSEVNDSSSTISVQHRHGSAGMAALPRSFADNRTSWWQLFQNMEEPPLCRVMHHLSRCQIERRHVIVGVGVLSWWQITRAGNYLVEMNRYSGNGVAL
jgi:hypothetical protein